MYSIRSLTGVLSAIDFPATRDDVLRLAQGEDVDRRITRWLEDLPEGSYSGVWEVCQALASGQAPQGTEQRPLADVSG